MFSKWEALLNHHYKIKQLLQHDTKYHRRENQFQVLLAKKKKKTKRKKEKEKKVSKGKRKKGKLISKTNYKLEDTEKSISPRANISLSLFFFFKDINIS